MITLTHAAAEDLHDDVRRDAIKDAQIGEERGLYEVAFGLEAAVKEAQDAGLDFVALDDAQADVAAEYGYVGR